MTKKSEKIESLKQEVPPYIDPKEVMKRVVFKPAELAWTNFQQQQPAIDRWILLWCNLGKIAPNIILTYRDASGNYDLPHPTKSYPVQAWAYVDVPQADEEELAKHKKEIEEASAKNLQDEIKAMQAQKPAAA